MHWPLLQPATPFATEHTLPTVPLHRYIVSLGASSLLFRAEDGPVIDVGLQI